MEQYPVVVVGAGPAGLAAAHHLVGHGIRPLVIEKADKVGGIARTETYKGYRFDIGGHRFYTKVEEVERLWHAMLGESFREVPRLSRIYYAGRYFNYPLNVANALGNLGPVESVRILSSYVKARVRPHPEEVTLEQWVTNRFGRRLYETFFQTYTEKVWGIPCDQIQAEWAAQRIRGLSLTAAVSNALLGTNNTKTLIKAFHYPVLGPGMMWERFREEIERHGGRVCLETAVTCFRRAGSCIAAVVARHGEGETEVHPDHVISSMPLPELVTRLDPPPPPEVLAAAGKLRYRALILVGLIVNRHDLFPDNWIYVHAPGVKVGRIQNFKNWSAAMVPDQAKTSLGMEYFCSEGDELWNMTDAELLALASRELVALGLAGDGDVEDGLVIRQPRAYPVYDSDYRVHLATVRQFLASIENLQTIGRNGMHRYNNQDHSMLTGILAARNILGETHDLWNVNTERSYYEDVAVPPAAPD